MRVQVKVQGTLLSSKTQMCEQPCRDGQGIEFARETMVAHPPAILAESTELRLYTTWSVVWLRHDGSVSKITCTAFHPCKLTISSRYVEASTNGRTFIHTITRGERAHCPRPERPTVPLLLGS